MAKNGNRMNIRKIYPGRTKGCNKAPGQFICKKSQKSGCRLCLHCRSLEK